MMKDIDNLCIKCFSELNEGAVCTECGYDNDVANDKMYLQAKTVLQDRYIVGAFDKQDSDSATYFGYDSQLDKRIVIREFYPKGMASRLEGSSELHIRQKFADSIGEYKNAFFELWTTLQKMHSLSAVVPVYDVFEENETVYAIIEYHEAIPLREYLLRNENGYISWDTARLMFMPVLTTLEALHTNGIVHGSITPDNLVLCRDGKVRLSPFCIQAAADISSDFEFIENAGYTALEQYDNSHKICPATDIYAFSAVIYRALVGTNPPSATSRETNDKLMIPNSIAETIPMHVIKAMGNGLQVYPEKRIKNVSDFRDLLDASPSVKAQSSGSSSSGQKEHVHYDYAQQQKDSERRAKRNKIIVWTLLILILVALCTGFYIVRFTDLVKEPEQVVTTTQPASYQVPDFVGSGYTKNDVEDNGAWNMQFSITYEEEYSADVAAGVIFKQSIPAGETVQAETAIVLTVSLGEQTAIVPEVAGLSIEDATKTLEELGFKVTAVEIYNDGAHKVNTVRGTYATAPKSGESVAVGEEVIVQYYGEVQTTQAATEANN